MCSGERPAPSKRAWLEAIRSKISELSFSLRLPFVVSAQGPAPAGCNTTTSSQPGATGLDCSAVSWVGSSNPGDSCNGCQAYVYGGVGDCALCEADTTAPNPSQYKLVACAMPATPASANTTHNLDLVIPSPLETRFRRRKSDSGRNRGQKRSLNAQCGISRASGAEDRPNLRRRHMQVMSGRLTPFELRPSNELTGAA